MSSYLWKRFFYPSLSSVVDQQWQTDLLPCEHALQQLQRALEHHNKYVLLNGSHIVQEWKTKVFVCYAKKEHTCCHSNRPSVSTELN